jgi:hypothetical protein
LVECRGTLLLRNHDQEITSPTFAQKASGTAFQCADYG